MSFRPTFYDAAVYVAGVWITPPPLRPGDKVRVVACSGPFDRTLFFRGAAWLKERYDLRIDRRLFRREGFLAGTDAERLHEFNEALRCPETRAVIAARGGYGAARIAPHVNLNALREHPKWLVGFSDVTAMHIEAQRFRVVTAHAANAAGLGRADARAREAWGEALLRPDEPRELRAPAPIRHGVAEGRLWGGNLSLLVSQTLAGRFRPPFGSVLFFEEVDETSYRVDRMLTALLESGALDRISAIAVGEMFGCSAGRHGVPVESVLSERLRNLHVPVAAGFPVGHGADNHPLLLGRPVRLTVTGQGGTLTLNRQ